MTTAAALPNPTDFQKATGATAEFRDQSVFIANAYSVNGKFYDITYDTSSAKLQKLRGLDMPSLVANLQEQMRAYLTASDALAAPEKTTFELTSKNDVYALPANQQKFNISDRTDPATGRTMKAFAASFHQTFGLAPPTDTNSNPVDEATAEDTANATSETEDTPTEASEAEDNEEPDESAAQTPKAPRNVIADIVRPVKIAGDLNNIGVGSAALMTGTAPAAGWSMYALCAGAAIGLLGNIKELYDHFVNGKPLPDNFGWTLLSNLALFLGPLLLVVGAFSNPYTAAAVLITLTVIGLAAYVKANWEGIKERFAEMSGLQRVLYALCFATVLGVTAFGVPGASYIAMAAMAIPIGSEVYNVYQKAKQPQDGIPPAQHRPANPIAEQEQRRLEEQYEARRRQAQLIAEQERREHRREDQQRVDDQIAVNE